MRLALVWAQTPEGVIGRDGTLPWHLPEDLARFRRLTSGRTVLMGRRTWQSLPERMRPLPDRRNVVLSRDPAFVAEGALVLTSFDAALARFAQDGDDEVWVIGGSALFAETIGQADRLEVTDVRLDVAGDTFAPAIDPAVWQPLDAAQEWSVSRTGTAYRFRSYVRTGVHADGPGSGGTGAVA